MNIFKKELLTGVIGCAFIAILLLFFVGKYNGQNILISVRSPLISVTPSITSSQGVGRQIILTNIEVAKHNTINDCWAIVNNKVYDVTEYANQHPGGAVKITDYCGTDMTKAFQAKGGKGTHSSLADQQHQQLFLGNLNDSVAIPIIKPTLQNRLQNTFAEKHDEENEDD